jgi:hypothetical protein
LLIALPVIWALLPGGLASTADGQVHFIRSAEMVNAWNQGIYAPRWSENLGFGLGIPLFIYAPPLPYFITSLLHSFGLSLEAAFKGMWLIALLLNAFGGYRLTRDPLGVWPGAATCAALVYAPLHLRELFIQGNAGQYLGWAFLPWICWSVIQIYRTGRVAYVVAAALAVCGVQLSHHVVALMGMGLAGGLWLFLAIGVGRLRQAAFSLGGLLLGLALGAWFWAPALLEIDSMRPDVIVASDFHTRFLTLAELISLSPRLDQGAINPFFPMTLGAVQGLFAVVGALIALFVLSQQGRLTLPQSLNNRQWSMARPVVVASIYFSCVFLFGAFMALSWSSLLWETLPFLDLFEFPWRWHGMTYVAVGWLTGFCVFAVGRFGLRWSAIAGSAALFLLIFSALVNLYPHKAPPDVFGGAPSDVVRYELRTGQVGTTSLGEFNPRWVDGVLTSSPVVDDYLEGRAVNRLPDPLPPGVTGEPLASNAQRHDFRIIAQQPTTMSVDLHYFPGWRAFSNGVPLPVTPHPGSGVIDVALPAGEQTLTLQFSATPLRQSVELISLAACVILACVVALPAIRRRQVMAQFSAEASVDGGQNLGAAPVIALLIMLIIVGLHAVGARWFTFASPPDRALMASTHLRADFADQLRVLGVDLPEPLAQPGESIAATVYLRALQPLGRDYSIFLHLDRPDGVTVASAQMMHPGDVPTSKWATGLHVRAPLRVTVPEGALPMRYRLRIGIVESKSGEWLSLADGSADVLEIGQVWVDGASAQPPAGPQARFGEEIHLLGAQVDANASLLRLHWRADQTPGEGLTIFVHFLDSQGELIAQADGAPFDGQYPLSAWRPDQVIEDVRTLPGLAEIAQVVLGVYDTHSGERLPAFDAAGVRLSNDSLMLSVH